MSANGCQYGVTLSFPILIIGSNDLPCALIFECCLVWGISAFGYAAVLFVWMWVYYLFPYLVPISGWMLRFLSFGLAFYLSSISADLAYL